MRTLAIVFACFLLLFGCCRVNARNCTPIIDFQKECTG